MISGSLHPPEPHLASQAMLFGADPTPGIVAVEVDTPQAMRVWRRVAEQVVEERVPALPYLWVTEASLLEGGPRPQDLMTLQGAGALRTLARYTDLDELQAALKALQKRAGATSRDVDAPYHAITDPVTAYLTVSGRTLFKELPFHALVRMQIDIETWSAPGFDHSHPARVSDRILAIGVGTNDGREWLLWGGDLDEKSMLLALGRLIEEVDPDVIEGHNIFRFDLDYLWARARLHGLRVDWGRGRRPVTVRASRLQVAERTVDYPRFDIPGRHVVDTWLLAQHYDISHRSLPSFGLKEVVRFFGLASPHRTYIDGSEVARTFERDPERLRAYCLDDVRETRALADLLLPVYHLQARLFPFTLQNVVLRGQATRIDALFVREYLRCGHALPQPASTGGAFEGGYAEQFVEGVVGPVLHVDVQSLYPSLMLSYQLAPRQDDRGVFLTLLEQLRAFRLEARDLARTTTDARLRAHYEALQSTFKVLINSFYGYLGSRFAHFGDAAVAAEVTRRGRELMTGMLLWLRDHACRPVEADTDGIYFVAPPGPTDALLAALCATLPAGVRLELAGTYPAMLSYKVKNYALLDAQGHVVIKGSSLRSRSQERYLRRFTEALIELLLHGRAREVGGLVRRTLDDLATHRIPLRDLAKVETLGDSLEAYKARRDAGKRNPAAAYELALASGHGYRAGDSVAYYVTGTTRKVKVYEQARLLTVYEASRPDDNVAYYQHKLLEHASKFDALILEAGGEPGT